MRYEDFLDRVRDEAGLISNEDADRLTEVVLTTLAPRITRSERSDLASELPAELGEFFDTEERREAITLEEFINQVSAGFDGSYVITRDRIRAVLRVLMAAVSSGQFHEVVDDLPKEYEQLFSAP